MQFCPGFDQSPLALRKGARQQFYRFNAVHCNLLLIVRVKVRCVVRGVRFEIHSNNDSEEATKFRHPGILPTRTRRGNGSLFTYLSSLLTNAERANDRNAIR